MYTYNENGEPEQGVIYIQLKATDNLTVLKDGVTISFQTDKRDLELWIDEPMPVFLIVYDAINIVAYWLHIQAYFKGIDFESVKDNPVVHFSTHNIVNETSVEIFRDCKRVVLETYWGC